MQVISVVRNFNMYNRLVRNNLYYNKDTVFTVFDNNEENKYISVRYNEFLKNYDYSKDDWFIFCHEDWELKEDLLPKLKNLDKNCLYGPIGVFWKKSCNLPILLGKIVESNKDGSYSSIIGNDADQNNNHIMTFDCQCLIVHSSLIKNYSLRFDENLSFDLYVEDFCINAKEKHNISSKILNIKCQHYSHGKITGRFYKQLKYLRNKYKKINEIYCTTVGGKFISGYSLKFIFYFICSFYIKKIARFIYQSKITNKGKKIIKIFKIPVFNKSIKEL